MGIITIKFENKEIDNQDIYRKKKILSEIQSQFEQLFKEVKDRKITIEEYLERDSSICSQHVEIAEVFDSIELLEVRIAQDFGRIVAHQYVNHEKEHEEIAKKYGISSKFLYIFLGHESLASTWCYDFVDKAKSWTFDKLEEFLTAVANIKNPDESDQKYLKLLKQ